MTKAMMEKVENLRKFIENKKLSYDHLCDILRAHSEFPSVTTLRRYNLLKIVGHEEFEVTMTDDEADYQYYEDMDGFEWDENRNLWVMMDSINYYGI